MIIRISRWLCFKKIVTSGTVASRPVNRSRKLEQASPDLGRCQRRWWMEIIKRKKVKVGWAKQIQWHVCVCVGDDVAHPPPAKWQFWTTTQFPSFTPVSTVAKITFQTIRHYLLILPKSLSRSGFLITASDCSLFWTVCLYFPAPAPAPWRWWGTRSQGCLLLPVEHQISYRTKYHLSKSMYAPYTFWNIVSPIWNIK